MRSLRFWFAMFAGLTGSASTLCAEPVNVTCTILPGAEAASVSLTNPLNAPASCMANCKFSTGAYDDNPQVLCAKPVPAGKQVEMCIIKAADNKLVKVLDAIGDCKKL